MISSSHNGLSREMKIRRDDRGQREAEQILWSTFSTCSKPRPIHATQSKILRLQRETKQMQRRTFFSLLWLGGAMLCAAAASVVASEPTSPEQTAAQILHAGKAQEIQTLKFIVRSLRHESPIARRAAVWSLGQLPEVVADHVPQLTAALADQDAHVRWGAAHALGSIGRQASKSESALWQATLDRDVEVRCAALIALRSVSVAKHSAALPALSECLQCSLSDVQSEAIATASQIHSRWDDAEKRTLVTQLAEVFAKSNDEVRLAAAVLLGDLGLSSASAMTALSSGTGDIDEHVQAAALRAIGRFAGEVDQRWSQLDGQQRNDLCAACEVAAKSLTPRVHEAAEIAAFAEQFRRLNRSTLVTAAESSLLLSKPATRVSKDNDAQSKPSSATSNGWLWGCVILFAGIGLFVLRQSLSGSSVARVESHDAPQSNDSTVGPAEAASSAEPDGAARRRAIESLSNVALEAAATLNQAMFDEDSVVRWRSASAVTAVHGATVPRLLVAVSSDDPEVRRLAVTSLRGLGANAVHPFAQALQDDDARVRQAAAITLGQIGLGAIDAVPQLIVALSDTDPRVRSAAAMALSVFGPHAMEAVPELRAALSDESPAVRARAAFALGQIGSSARRAADELSRLVSDPDVSVRRNSVSALGGIGADTAVVLPALRQAANDSDAGVRRCALTTLGLFDPRGAATISSTVRPDRGQSELKVFRPSVPADEPVVTCDVADLIAELENSDADIRWKASQNLEQLGALAVPEMIASLSHRNPIVRKSLVVVLGRVGVQARSAAPAILVALHDVNGDVRCAAADCLGQLGVVTRPMIQALVRSLCDPNAEVRRYAATTLGRFGQQAREATTALKIASISDITTKVRTAAQAALQRISVSLVEAA